jgi:hypothetical protein
MRWTVIVAGVVAVAAAQPAGTPADVSALLARIGERVEQYYARAKSIVCVETVRIEHMDASFRPDTRHTPSLVFELRVSRDATPEGIELPKATVLRQLLTVDGRPPRPKDESPCEDPTQDSTEPLTFLLPVRQKDYAFTWGGAAKVDGRAAVILEYRQVAHGEPQVFWIDKCVQFLLPGHYGGRVWADPETGEVLRFDEQLMRMFEIRRPRQFLNDGGSDSIIIERDDMSTRFKAVTFHDPEEQLLLPSSIQSTVVTRGAMQRTRRTQTFTNYRRFITGGRLVKDPGAR